MNLWQSLKRCVKITALMLVLAALAAGCYPSRFKAFSINPVTVKPTIVKTAVPATMPAARDASVESELDKYKINLAPNFRGAVGEFNAATRYQINLVIEDSITLISGSQQVRYTNNETAPLNEIYFRMFPNASGNFVSVDNVKVNGRLAGTALEFEKTALRVKMLQPLKPGEFVDISMDFTQHVPAEMGGNYGLYVFQEEILALDAFFPIIPVYDEQGWNVEKPPVNADMIFTDAAFFEVTVSAPRELVLVASGVETDSVEDNGRQIKIFRAGPQRDFYLAASHRFTSLSRRIGATLVTSYFLPEYQEMGEMVLETAVRALRIFSGRYGEYPYSELDVVSTPMQAGGMEYSGVVAMALYFYQPDASLNGMPGRDFLESATAHEVAHQWFFNQVMNDQIDEPWLDEGFAQYLTSIYYLDAIGELAADSYRGSWQSRWSRANFEEIPIGLPAAEYDQLNYSAIIYGRAPLFIQALESQMGASTFSAFLRDYVDTYRWQVVDTSDFLSLAEQSCDCQLDNLADEYGVNPAQ